MNCALAANSIWVGISRARFAGVTAHVWGVGVEERLAGDLRDRKFLSFSASLARGWGAYSCPRWARMPRTAPDTAETGVREGPFRHNALRTPAPRPIAASMNTPRTDGRGRTPSDRLIILSTSEVGRLSKGTSREEPPLSLFACDALARELLRTNQ